MPRALSPVALVAALGVAVGAHAADLTIVRERSGTYAAYAFGEAGFHRLDLGLSRVSRVEVGQGLARVSSGRLELLVAATPAGVVQRRIDGELGSVRAFRGGDRLALVLGRRGWVAYGVTADGIAARVLTGTLSVGNVSGDMAWIRIAGDYGLLAATPRGVAWLPVGDRPQRVELGRNQALTYFSGGRVYLHAPADDGIHTVDVSRSGRPQQIWLGGAQGTLQLDGPRPPSS